MELMKMMMSMLLIGLAMTLQSCTSSLGIDEVGYYTECLGSDEETILKNMEIQEVIYREQYGTTLIKEEGQ